MDSSNPNSVLIFEDYNSPLIDLLSSLAEEEKVVLVGHSAGGVSLTHAIHMFGKKIDLAIYVGAKMLLSGFRTQQDIIDAVPDLSEFGKNIYDLEFGMGRDQPPTSTVIKMEFRQEIIYQISPLEDCSLASMLVKPGPVRAVQGAQFVEGEEVDEIKRMYIKTMHNRMLKPTQQDAMIKRWASSDVFVAESDHSPNFSAPFELFNLLHKACNLHARV
ncbi:hypothetical protein GIB67_038900 [Kingdonia uniflora]|uniref:AB hydrolase-1 domain-containing protein n=1 Tax=Kingdonia uniflora TaxID=39325 RepID=A0A7J7LQ65_9MAGN|nr:hypothetical protein GIB67_038900 [Kingdonia uniflora]